MDFINLPLLAVAAVLFLSLALGVFSTRAGFPLLLVFLVAGALAGEDGPGGYHFDDFALSFWVGNVALAVILLDGGLRTSFSRFRTGLKPSLLLATFGVALTAAVTGVTAMWLLDLEWKQGLLLGAIVGSTDAAAVFALLERSGVMLNERVSATLEIESGMNDPMAVYLTLALIATAAESGTGGGHWGDAGLSLLQQFGWGALVGVLGGFAVSAFVNRMPGDGGDGGIVALMIGAAGLGVFAGTGLIGGSGFLAVYLFGLILAKRAAARIPAALSAMDGYAWLAQAGMFLLLGLLVTPSALVTTAWPALGVACVLMFVARPLAVWLCLAPFRFRPHEVWFIAWVGLRGAVPIVLAIFPLIAGVSRAMLLFNVAFVVVLASLLLQGTTIGLVARRLRVALPSGANEREMRAVFGDFSLDANAPIGSICGFYGLPVPPEPDRPVAAWLATALGRPPVVGDHLRIGHADLSVRAMEGPRITAVGLKLEGDAVAGG
ncbi:MAG: potassium/proton antiporter [Burkholderiales bacterium]|nr:potassium/proton antiporter [Burkholderiales bacterium]MDE1926112.1 potassium/proton antiporter [Burkholderiales bacterium]MDE2158285.1 potassium/proton antiporter [Burkholderiales bacterium]MDE2501681.1 potassium/proton antiporter [Burkholderiales bacterium]